MLNLIIEIAVIHTLFYYIYQYLINLPLGLISYVVHLQSEFIAKWIGRITMAIGSFIIGTLTGFTVINLKEKGVLVIFYIIIGAIFITANYLLNTAQKKKDIENKFNFTERWEAEEELRYEIIYLFIAVSSLICSIIFPTIIENYLTTLFITIINLIMSSIIKYVIYVLAVFYVILVISSIYTFYSSIKHHRR